MGVGCQIGFRRQCQGIYYCFIHEVVDLGVDYSCTQKPNILTEGFDSVVFIDTEECQKYDKGAIKVRKNEKKSTPDENGYRTK